VSGLGTRGGTGLRSGGYGRSMGRRSHRRRSTRSSGVGARRLVALAVVLVAAFVLFALVQWLRPSPSVRVRVGDTSVTIPGHLSLPWPTQGSAALALPGVGFIGSSGSNTPVPIASITKVMTAVLTLHDHPLGPGQPGPTITITPADVNQYQSDLATQQSVVAVAAGEQLTEVQALEGLLIPSGNNMADVLAQWDDGSVAAFVAAMNKEAAALGLHHTHFASPSGLDPGSVSTPKDLVRLGETAMANPVFASIVGMPQATVPVAGTVINYDYNLGKNGFVGIKTGSDSQAGGCFLFEADVPSGGQEVPVIGAVLGQQTAPIIQTALNAATSLVSAVAPQLSQRTLVHAGQQVATVESPWGQSTPVVATQALSVRGWPGLAISGHLHLLRLGSTVRPGQVVGQFHIVVDGSVHDIPVAAAHAVTGPGFGFDLTNL